MIRRLQVLVACPNLERRQTLTSVLSHCGLEPVFSSTVDEARAILSRQFVPLIICEDGLPDGDFHDVLRAARSAGATIPVVVTSRLGDMQEYLDAMSSGAFDFVASPIRPSELEHIVSCALHKIAA